MLALRLGAGRRRQGDRQIHAQRRRQVLRRLLWVRREPGSSRRHVERYAAMMPWRSREAVYSRHRKRLICAAVALAAGPSGAASQQINQSCEWRGTAPFCEGHCEPGEVTRGVEQRRREYPRLCGLRGILLVRRQSLLLQAVLPGRAVRSPAASSVPGQAGAAGRRDAPGRRCRPGAIAAAGRQARDRQHTGARYAGARPGERRLRGGMESGRRQCELQHALQPDRHRRHRRFRRRRRQPRPAFGRPRRQGPEDSPGRSSTVPKGRGSSPSAATGKSFAGSYNFGTNPDVVQGTWNGTRR